MTSTTPAAQFAPSRSQDASVAAAPTAVVAGPAGTGPRGPTESCVAAAFGRSGNTSQDDRGGGTVLDYAYDSADRLVAVTQGAATVADHLHNAMGQRVAKTVGGATTHFLYDLSGRLVGEADGATGAATAEYVWLEGMPLAFVQGGAVYYVHTDHLGTPQRLTDGTRAVVWDAGYAPFGAATVSGSVTFNLRFPVQQSRHKTNALIHWATLLPRHLRPPENAEMCNPCARNGLSPMSREGQINNLAASYGKKSALWGRFCHKNMVLCNSQKSATV